MNQHFNSNGKLLLTAEFLVLDGAQALAVPCQYGQSMEVENIEEPEIIFESYTDEGKMWYEGIFSISEEEGIQNIYSMVYGSSAEKEAADAVSARMDQIFNAMFRMKREFFLKGGFIIKNRLDFPRQWGLGTSSTLLSNLAEWADINPYYLSGETFGGSAYDIACATSSQPILYQRTADLKKPLIGLADFDPPFKEELFFVYLNRKQDTREIVKHYKASSAEDKTHWIEQASALTKSFIDCKTLDEFEHLMKAHESLLSKVLDLPSVKIAKFYDFKGAVKSLGGWGGDFILATGGKEARDYFKNKGYNTIVKYTDMVLNVK